MKDFLQVQYRDLRERFSSDVATMEAVLDTVQIFHPKFAFKWVFKELRDTLQVLSSSILQPPVLQAELDFQKEAANSVRCAKELAGLEWLYVPPVVQGLTSQASLPTLGRGSESVSSRGFSPPSSSTGSRSATWTVSPPWASASPTSTPSSSESSPSR